MNIKIAERERAVEEIKYNREKHSRLATQEAYLQRECIGGI